MSVSSVSKSKKSHSKDEKSDEKDHIHRLVQDENAKTILLNVPLDPDNPSNPILVNKPPLGDPKLVHNTRRPTLREKSLTRGLRSKPNRIRSASVGRDKRYNFGPI